MRAASLSALPEWVGGRSKTVRCRGRTTLGRTSSENGGRARRKRGVRTAWMTVRGHARGTG
eukprot:5734386-Prymnesium_polylepis.1